MGVLIDIVVAHLLFGCIAVALASLGLRLVRRSSASVRHSVWLIVLVIIMFAPMLSLLPQFSFSQQAAPAPDPAAAGSEFAGNRVSMPSAQPPAAPLSVSTKSVTDGRSDRETSLLTKLILATGLLIAFSQLIQLLRAMRYSRLLRVTSMPAQRDTQGLADSLCRSLGIRRSVPIRLSDRIASPQTNGALRPWVLLPDFMDQDRHDILKDVLAHELAHVRRGDPWIVWVEFVARIFTGFNPAVWYAIHQIRRERESACDDWVMGVGSTPQRYARSLVAVAESLIPAHGPELAVSCLRSRSHLRRRIHHMLDPKKNHSIRSLGITVSVVSLVGIVGLATARPLFPQVQAFIPTVAWVNAMARSTAEPDHDQALLHAAYSNDLGRAQELLESGIDPDTVYRHDPRTALIAAARNNHWEMVRLLVANGADVNFHARGDETPLMAVVRGGDPDTISLLLQMGADANRTVKGDGSPLISASRTGNAEAVRMLLDAGADPDRYVRGDEAPLYHAVIRGHADVAYLLLDAGAKPSAEYDGDGTPLMLAIQHGHADIAAMLLDKGAQVGSVVRGDGTALIAAARRNDVEMARQLILRGADVNQAVRGDGNPLINAARRGHVEVAQLLLSAGASPNLHVEDDDTPLINAVWSRKPEMVQLLLDHGADPTGEGDFDRRLGDVRTPLNVAGENSEIHQILRAAVSG